VRGKARNPAQRLRTAVDALPRRTRAAMLEGIRSNPIIAGGYTQKGGGGVCPMLAAHRNGGRTNLASFARAWDRFTGARRPRLATRRELRALESYLELSLLRDEQEELSVTALAAQLRAERRDAAARSAPAPEPASTRRRSPDRRAPTGERHRARELRRRARWAWVRPTRSYEVFEERLAAAEEQLSEERARELLAKQRAVQPN
jgi:hypothetical protein